VDHADLTKQQNIVMVDKLKEATNSHSSMVTF